MSLPPSRRNTPALLALALALGACGRDEEIVTAPLPPQMQFSPDVLGKTESPRYAAFRSLVEARQQAIGDRRKLGRSTDGSDPAERRNDEIQKLSERIMELTADINRAMAEPGVTDEDRTVMRAIISRVARSKADRP